MQIGCYILFSAKLDKHYIGACQAGFTQRLEAHNSAYYGSQSFTSSANDWELKIFIPTITFGQALGIERKIKRMKSRKYIENLIKYPELIEKILNENI